MTTEFCVVITDFVVEVFFEKRFCFTAQKTIRNVCGNASLRCGSLFLFTAQKTLRHLLAITPLWMFFGVSCKSGHSGQKFVELWMRMCCFFFFGRANNSSQHDLAKAPCPRPTMRGEDLWMCSTSPNNKDDCSWGF